MTIGRRTFLSGAATGVGLLVLAGCTPPRPTPTRSVTKAPVPTPSTTAVPTPSAFVRSGWGTDPFALGSTSYLPVGATPEHRDDLAQNVLDRVFFAGEATDSSEPGTLQGAWNSGVRAAGEIAAVAGDGERIAIVGAGLAGAIAARRLVDAGYDVTLVEARERTGGRIATTQPDGWPVAVDSGAWALAGAGPALRESVLDAGVGTTPIDLAAIRSVAPDGSVLDVGTTGADALTRALEWGAEQSEDVPLAEAFAGSGAADPAEAEAGSGDGEPERVAAFLAGGAALTTGAAPAELSSWYGLGDASAATTAQELDDDSERADAVLTDGLAPLVASLLEDVEVSLRAVVSGIGYDEEGASVRLATGESFSADRVLVTVPIGVLKTDAIVFDPPLPFAHRTAIAAIGSGVVETLWLRFDESFWDADADAVSAVRWSLVGSEAGITEWVNLQPVTGETVLIGLVGADQALSLQALSDDELLTVAVTALEPFAVVPD
ncbi:NAD(P)/FAD-dependent oxidoreductase [Rathayibacter sp. Leaf248]|uniref:NAD(P)/FAD-dependent oxidoreductase n=1 Tax=Rathayibacter sp. Leaf248 TaxID=2876555 RepID=UPI001E452509|nr:NAD(P)/FAD-dependent oxidoreductase [Rathayibacter sp. Leaf248]